MLLLLLLVVMKMKDKDDAKIRLADTDTVVTMATVAVAKCLWRRMTGSCANTDNGLTFGRICCHRTSLIQRLATVHFIFLPILFPNHSVSRSRKVPRHQSLSGVMYAVL